MFIIGCDVSKKSLHCELLLSLNPLKRRKKTVSNCATGALALLTWASRQAHCTAEQFHVVMEATGIYHETAASTLVQAGARVSVVNPALIRDYARSLGVHSKTDGIDAGVLARYGVERNPEPWQPPALEVTQLRALLARLQAVETDLRRESNRLEKSELCVSPKIVLDSLEHSLAFLKQQKDALMKEISDHIDRHPRLKQDRDLLQSIPAVGAKTAWRMLCVLHSRPFRKARAAAAFLGLVPVEHESGTSVRQAPHLSKAGNPAMRAALYMAAVVAIRFNPDIRAQYERLLRKGKSKMSAIGAAMRKLVHICFGVLKSQKPYSPQTPNTA